MTETCTIQYFDSKNHIDDFLSDFMINGLNEIIKYYENEKKKWEVMWND